ncbi:Rh type B glycoprotein [Planoprotostelium fungivorum]|uniref:Rh type B glycoprotein n=1 Tax=Planoprotostelium fungivorum TaxID=1890364 RepID=A0A2P6ND42_9EUKA|nr:Rh type B glycoprotein [Planoprotostelium fungivorum]
MSTFPIRITQPLVYAHDSNLYDNTPRHTTYACSTASGNSLVLLRSAYGCNCLPAGSQPCRTSLLGWPNFLKGKNMDHLQCLRDKAITNTEAYALQFRAGPRFRLDSNVTTSVMNQAVMKLNLEAYIEQDRSEVRNSQAGQEPNMADRRLLKEDEEVEMTPVQVEIAVPKSRSAPTRGKGKPSALAIGSLLFAASEGDAEMVEHILQEGSVSVNDTDYDKRTAMHVAAAEGREEVLLLLIEHGADLNCLDRWKSSPLDDAIHHNHEACSKLIANHGGRHGHGTNYALDLVHAAGTGDLSTVQKLLDNGIDVNSTDYDLRTPLHVAIAGRHVKMVEYLLQQPNVDLHCEDRFGSTPVQEAHRCGVRLGDDLILDLIRAKLGGNNEEDEGSWKTSFTNTFFWFFLLVEIAIGVLYAIFSEYAPAASPGVDQTTGIEFTQLYPFYMDVHVMIFIGFGFLMTFLRKHGYTAVGMTFLLGVASIQVYLLFGTFWDNIIVLGGSEWERVSIDVLKLIKADFAAGAVLISFGALIGKVTPTQMLGLAILEVFFYSANEAIGLRLRISDIGGSMTIHVFGAFFGLAASAILTPRKARGNQDNAAVYHSDLFSMIGTVFLWMYWPSFNAALGQGNTQHRAVINTVLSLTASCFFAFISSQFWRKERVFNMIDIQNATLAGGVAAGSAADMVLHPSVALLVGAVSGTVSVFGFSTIQGFLERTTGIHDTCGILNLHGLPGIIGAVVSMIATAATQLYPNEYNYNQLIYVYPGRTDRSPNTQAQYQLAFLIITLAMSIFTGILCGIFLSKLKKPNRFFSDDESWEVPHREVPYYYDERGEIIRNKDSAEMRGELKIDHELISQLENKVAALEKSIQSHRRTTKRNLMEMIPPAVIEQPAQKMEKVDNNTQPSNADIAALLRLMTEKLDNLTDKKEQ